MVLQMRPHFIYNTMMSIYYLCKQDADLAEKENAAGNMESVLDELREELKIAKRQRVRDLLKRPDNEEIITMGMWVLVIDWFLEIGRTSNIFAVGTLRATGDAIYPVIIALIFNWSIAVGVSYIIGISLGYGLVGMWVGFALDENIRGVILLRRWRSGKWRDKGFVKAKE